MITNKCFIYSENVPGQAFKVTLKYFLTATGEPDITIRLMRPATPAEVATYGQMVYSEILIAEDYNVAILTRDTLSIRIRTAAYTRLNWDEANNRVVICTNTKPLQRVALNNNSPLNAEVLTDMIDKLARIEQEIYLLLSYVPIVTNNIIPEIDNESAIKLHKKPNGTLRWNATCTEIEAI